MERLFALITVASVFEYMRKNKDDDEDDANEQRLSNSLGARTMRYLRLRLWKNIYNISFEGKNFFPPNLTNPCVFLFDDARV